MAHSEVLPECKVQLSLLKTHLEESPEHRDKITVHDEQLKTIFNKFDDFKEFRREFRIWALGIIISVVIGLIWFGGKLNALDRLERLHPIEKERLVVNSR